MHTLAICISGQPPPYSTRASAVAALSTHSASCSDRSASSSTCEPVRVQRSGASAWGCDFMLAIAHSAQLSWPTWPLHVASAHPMQPCTGDHAFLQPLGDVMQCRDASPRCVPNEGSRPCNSCKLGAHKTEDVLQQSLPPSARQCRPRPSSHLRQIHYVEAAVRHSQKMFGNTHWRRAARWCRPRPSPLPRSG